MPCFESKDKLDAFAKSTIEHDDYGAQQAMEGSLTLPEGTRVQAIDTAEMLSDIQLRVETGNDAGASCWYPQGASLFKDVKQPG